MKKFRGKRKYYAKIEKVIDEYNLDTSHDSWYEFWHIHIDWRGYGNLGWRHRKQHLVVLFKIFDKLLGQAENFNQPYQIWLSIDITDASNDAIYVHTKNPNENNFPLKIEKVDWGVKPPGSYQDLLDKELHEFGLLTNKSKSYFLIRSIKHGIPI